MASLSTRMANCPQHDCRSSLVIPQPICRRQCFKATTTCFLSHLQGFSRCARTAIQPPTRQRQHTRSLLICSSANANAESFPQPQATPSPEGGRGNRKVTLLVSVGAILLAAVGLGVWHTGSGAIIKDLLANSALGKSGFLAALSLIFLSELGDKTFFIAALMAMKLGKWVTFAGTMTALSIMSVISVVIGVVFKNVPDLLTTSVPIGEYIGIALLLYFGINSIKDGLSSSAGEDEDSELSEAQDEVERAEAGGKITAQTPWTTLLEVTSLIFVAEWGDRSMLATIALGASASPIGVASGAIAGHAVATVIAILGGVLLKQYISEKTVNIIGGVCFLLFAVLTLFHIF